MKVASVANEGLVADETLIGFFGLILQSSSVSSGKTAWSITDALRKLTRSDAVFADWIFDCANLACELRSSLNGEMLDSRLQSRATIASNSNVTQQPNGEDSRDDDLQDDQGLSHLVAWLPEVAVRRLATLHVSSESLRENLSQACHLAVRARATSASMQADQERREIERIYQFAYGLSHELNNPLANISTRAGVLLQSQRLNADEKDLIQSIIDSAMRGSEMLGDLMLVARPPSLQMQSFEPDLWLSQFVSDALPWVNAYRQHLHFDAHFPGSMYGDPAALREVLWAVVRNSIEASEAGATIQLLLEKSRTGQFALSVQDQGSGLSAQALRHAFDPYYSGREAGRGLGLGLSKARRIVELHNGQIAIENAAMGGCRIMMVIPLER